MPGGLGLHPWFAGRLLLRIEAASALASNIDPHSEAVPVSGDLDMRRERELPSGIDASWTDLDEPVIAALRWPKLGIRALFRSLTAPWLVAASAPELGAIAVEPQTHAPWGLRRLVDGEPGGLALIAPGATLSMTTEIDFSD